jgi:23S rRNA pseudouridine2457 synthase
MSDEMYFILNKPVNMVSQFKSPYKVRLLGDLVYKFPEGTHAIGRLDSESEGLLILTTNKKITRLLFHPTKKHLRTYLVMVKNVMKEETVQKIRDGIPIRIEAGVFYTAIPEKVELVADPLKYYKYATDHRSTYPHSWLLITLSEGKYHQIRKMVFTAGHRCLRLARLSIEELTLGDIPQGEVKEIMEEDFFRLLKL